MPAGGTCSAVSARGGVQAQRACFAGHESTEQAPSLSCLQTFIKVVNYQHMMPTRYTLDVDLKSAVPADVLDQEDKKDEARRVRACVYWVMLRWA